MNGEGRSGRVIETDELGTVEICGHAVERMEQRGISEDEIIETIANPTSTELPTQPGRHRCRRNRNRNEAIDVVYVEERDRITVVTTMVVRKRRSRRRR